MNRVDVQSSCSDDNEADTLSVDAALLKMLNAVAEKSGSEHIPLTSAVDRILAAPILSPINVPSHRNAAVDGYAIIHTDLPSSGEIKTLNIVGRIVAGHPYKGRLKQGECLQIMTGAQMPDAADTVIMQEHVEIHDNTIHIDARHKNGQNVRQAGEDIQQNHTVLEAGIKLTPPQIGLIASLGISEVHVKTPLTIAVFSTGDELLSLGEPPREGCIYDSNRYSMISALKKIGCKVLDMGIIADDPEQLRSAFKLASNSADVIFTSGGVSVGAADYTKQILAETGSINFWKVAIKPGRPIAFGHIDNTTFFGLPGNPVAVMVTFYQFALPCLQKMMGLTTPLICPTIQAKSTHSIRKIAGRTEFQRGFLSKNNNGEWEVSTTGKQGSGILRSMSDANAFIILEHERPSINKGDWVITQPFSALF
ncbi:MAG: molybdopterin molybdotransferase MoeA [Cycloclasticus sp.]|jgi:molybdopterin molybdotransferase|uniref:molybdopterin molybdotransferase MoeA n=1 Tax=Cycloclasticus TaxID=34067 RepID=UPI000381DEA9|nr:MULTISPECIES: gephyrin-like molybdotransferase Glp [Cycloclasticus]MBV1897771.1 molybdopterin molybdotransferase MoeA [Cycloclasticus sp.]